MPKELSHAEILTLEQVEDYKKAFALYDKNSNGTISAKQLLSVMRSLGENPTEEDMHSIMIEMDKDKNGKIDFHEFLEKMVERNEKINENEELRNAFRVFDKDGRGKINIEEFRTVMVNLGNILSDEEVEDLLSAADRDSHGCVNYEEFVTMMTGGYN